VAAALKVKHCFGCSRIPTVCVPGVAFKGFTVTAAVALGARAAADQKK